VRSLIEHGYFRKKHARDKYKKSSISSFIDINNLDMDHQKAFPDYGKDLGKYMTNDDIQYLDRVDTDFFKYYMDNARSFAGIKLEKGEDLRHRTIPYDLKVMFLACKLCKFKTQYFSAKYHEIANKIRSFIREENTLSANPTAHYSKADPKYMSERKIDPNISKQEQERLIRMNERHKKKKKYSGR
jgi:hypothetical protein